jgi:O-acetyl-ADP-ribose deacetylase (regulator of RNase III)
MGFDLPARHVIHVVGPVYSRHPDPAGALASAHRNALSLAEQVGLRIVAFPAISCGVYGYPLDEAAGIAVGVARERSWDLDEVRFVLFGASALAAWEHALS